MNNYMVRQLRNIALSFRSRLISLSPYLLFFILQFSFFNSSEAQRPKKPSKPAPTVLSVGDLLHNYGLDTTLVNDTAVAVRYLDEQPQNYVDLTNLCVSFRTKAQSAIAVRASTSLHFPSLATSATTALKNFAKSPSAPACNKTVAAKSAAPDSLISET